MLLVVVGFSDVVAGTITWTNVNGGNWSTAANWNPNQVPDANDTAVISASGTYTVTLDVGTTVTGLTLGGTSGQQTLAQNGQSLTLSSSGTVGPRGVYELNGNLTCNASFNVSGRVTWNVGIITGSITVATGGSVNLETVGNHELVGTLTSSGAVRWNQGHFFLENGSTFLNQAGGLFDVLLQEQWRFISSGSGPNRFVNEGTFRKTSSPVLTSVEVDFDNRGSVELQTGTLSFPNGFASRGSFAVSDGARLSLAGGTFTLNSGHNFTGAGFYGVDTGSVTIIGDLTSPNFQLTNGTFDSTNRLTGALRWSGGLLRGSYTVATGGKLIVETDTNHEFIGTLTNAGTVSWNEGHFLLENGSTFLNQASGRFEVLLADGRRLISSGSGPNRFINEGIFRKSGNETATSIEVEFDNRGRVELQSGTLTFPNGFASRGTFDVAAGTRLSMAGGLFRFDPGHTFTGAGFYGMDNGTVTILGDLTSPNLQLASGALESTNRLTGTLHWIGGQLRGDFILAASGKLILETDGNHEYFGTLTNGGTVSWNQGHFILENGSTFLNQAGGLFEVLLADGRRLIPSGSGPNRFINEGIVRKSGNETATIIEVEFDNRGRVDLQSGTLTFPNGFASRGAFDVAAGTRLSLASGIFRFDPGHSFTGAGFYGMDNGTVTILGDLNSPNLQLASGALDSTNRLTGTLHWSGGQLRGNYTVATSGKLILETDVSHEYFGTLSNGGTVSWKQGHFFLENGSTFLNQAGGLFEVMQADERRLIPSGSEPNRFVNEGTFRKGGSSVTTSIEVEFVQRGGIEVQNGTLSFANGLVQTAGKTLISGGNLSASQPIEIRDGELAGTGTVTANVINSGKVSPGASPGRLNIIGDYTQSASGELIIELAGLTDDAFDQLSVSGAVKLDGQLSTPLIRAFSPPTNSAFTFLSAGSLTGQFAKHNFPASQIDAQVSYDAKSATLKVVNVFTVVSKFAPILAAIPNQTVNELSTLSLTATATDADVPANILTFRLDSAPIGAAIDPNTGILTWTPTEEQGPGVHPITVRVSDNGALFDTKTFNVTVKEVNQAPTLGLIPPQLIAAGGTLKFTAVAADADLPPQKLTFGVGAGAPPNASINATTGEFIWNVPANQPTGIATVTLRVTDDGPPALSASRDVLMEVDRTGPRIVGMSPTGQVSKLVDHIDLTFDTPINPVSVDPGDAILSGPSGSVATTVQVIGEKIVRVSFAALAPGDYTLKVGPDVTDLAGNPMNQDGDDINGEAVQDVFVGQLSVGLADLQVSAITLPAEALIGQPVEIIWTLLNKGNVAASAPWTDTLVLRNDTSEHFLANFAHNTALAVNQSMTLTQSVILPAGVSGPRFVAIRTDSSGEVAEGANESNNETVSTKPINILAPDLVATLGNVPASPQFGQTINVTWTVKNQGTGQALANWNDNLYLATDAKSPANGILLLSQHIENATPLAVGASYSRSQAVTLPLSTTLLDGAYFLVIVSDIENAQGESDEANNTASQAFTITRPPLPDLTVSTIQIPATGAGGRAIEIKWNIKNEGAAAASPTWAESIYLANAPNGGSEQLLDTITVTLPLAAGASIQRKAQVTLGCDSFCRSVFCQFEPVSVPIMVGSCGSELEHDFGIGERPPSAGDF